MQDFDSQYPGAPQCPAVIIKGASSGGMAPCPPPPITGTPRLCLLSLSFSLKPGMATLTYTQALDQESFLLHGRRGQSILPRDSRRSLKPQQTLGKCPWGATMGGGLPPHPSPDLESRTECGKRTKAPGGLSRFQGSHHPCLCHNSRASPTSALHVSLQGEHVQ